MLSRRFYAVGSGMLRVALIWRLSIQRTAITSPWFACTTADLTALARHPVRPRRAEPRSADVANKPTTTPWQALLYRFLWQRRPEQAVAGGVVIAPSVLRVPALFRLLTACKRCRLFTGQHSAPSATCSHQDANLISCRAHQQDVILREAQLLLHRQSAPHFTAPHTLREAFSCRTAFENTFINAAY